MQLLQRRRSLFATLIAVVAILAFPASSVLAVSQVVRDESDACCVSFSNGWNADSSNNGYDNNTLYAHNDLNTGAGPWLRWFPYPSSDTFMCAYVHIPTVDNGGYVYYQGGANNKSSGTIYQADYSNWWWYAYTDYYGYYNGMQINSDSANQFHSNTYAADAVSFHYPSC